MKSYYIILDLNLKNVELIKCPGAIAYAMSNYGYNVNIITYGEDDFCYKDKLKGVNLIFVEKRFVEIIDRWLFIIRNSKKIDILQLYHLGIKTAISGVIYKILNHKGILYLRSDITYEDLERLLIIQKVPFFIKIKRMIIKLFISFFVDIISVETDKNYELLKTIFNSNKIILLPHTCLITTNEYSQLRTKLLSVTKENLILTVGRLGTKQKATEILLEAFTKINGSDWKLLLIGPLEKEFEKYLFLYFNKYPILKKRILILGNITDRERLYDYYLRSKIFVLPSRWESFGIVLVEALISGCYIISTDVGAAKMLIKETGYGSIVEKDNIDDLAQKLQDAIYMFDKNQKNYLEISQYVFDSYYPINLYKPLAERIRGIRKK